MLRSSWQSFGIDTAEFGIEWAADVSTQCLHILNAVKYRGTTFLRYVDNSVSVEIQMTRELLCHVASHSKMTPNSIWLCVCTVARHNITSYGLQYTCFAHLYGNTRRARHIPNLVATE
jgi:hypothetical protein